MTPEEQAKRAIGLLKQKIRDHVHSTGDTVQAFERRHFYARWFDQLGGRIRLNARAFFTSLQAINISPVAFVQELLEGDTSQETEETHTLDPPAPGKRAVSMAWAVTNSLLSSSKTGTPRRTLLGWRSKAAQARLSALLLAARRSGQDEVRFLVEALSGFARCGEDTARLIAKVLGTSQERFTPEVNKALEGLQFALDTTEETEDTPERFLTRFRQLWASRTHTTGTLGKQWLEAKDEQRYSDAPGVVAEFDQRLEDIEPDLVPLALGVLGSALRLDFWYDRAELCIQLGLECADEVLDHSAAGDLHQRMTMIKWDTGEQEAAFAENGLALARFLEADDTTGQAKTTVHKGGLLLYRGEFTRSIRVFSSVLDKVPEGRFKLATLNGLFQCHLQLGDTLRARRLIKRVQEMPLATLDQGKAIWGLGSLRHLEGKFDEALGKLDEARQLIWDIAPVDCALITIDLCEVYIEAGQMAQAKAEARTMMQFIRPLRALTPLAEAAARALALAGTRAEGITLVLLEECRKKLRAKPVRVALH